MVEDQFDMFNKNKSVIEAQINSAIVLLKECGYSIVKGPDAVRDLAIKHGYKVTAPMVVDGKIANMRDLRNYFFKRLFTKYPAYAISYIENINHEMRMIKYFVESREKTGLNRFYAIQECMAIIDVIFDYEKEFNFKKPIDIRVLGQKKSGWITEKALNILKAKLQKSREEELQKKIEEREDNSLNLKNKSKELGAILSKMEADNG